MTATSPGASLCSSACGRKRTRLASQWRKYTRLTEKSSIPWEKTRSSDREKPSMNDTDDHIRRLVWGVERTLAVTGLGGPYKNEVLLSSGDSWSASRAYPESRTPCIIKYGLYTTRVYTTLLFNKYGLSVHPDRGGMRAQARRA
eukprot:88144-Pyramimonas_sp.AAC.1